MFERVLIGIGCLCFVLYLGFAGSLGWQIYLELSATLGDGFLAEFGAITSALTVALIIFSCLMTLTVMILAHLSDEAPHK